MSAKHFSYVHLGKTGSSTTSGREGPTDPTSLSANVISATEIDLSWTAGTGFSNGAITYNIYRDTHSSPTTLITNVATTSFNNTGLVTGTHYYYAVETSESINGTEFLSNQATADATTS